MHSCKCLDWTLNLTQISVDMNTLNQPSEVQELAWIHYSGSNLELLCNNPFMQYSHQFNRFSQKKSELGKPGRQRCKEIWKKYLKYEPILAFPQQTKWKRQQEKPTSWDNNASTESRSGSSDLEWWIFNCIHLDWFAKKIFFLKALLLLLFREDCSFYWS